MYGVGMLIAVLTGVGDDQENPAYERRWKALLIAIDACAPNHRMEEVRDDVRSET